MKTDILQPLNRRARMAVRPSRLVTAFLLCCTLRAGGLAAQTQQPTAESQAPEAPAQPAASPVYDGEWWLTLGGWEQYGVVSGYEDCYVSEYRGTVPFTKEVQSYIDDLNKYYLADPNRRKQTVSGALDELRGAVTDSTLPASKAANPPPTDQAVYDGRFWFDADPAAEIGYLEGYFACHAAKLKNADAKFSKTPQEYIDLINKELGITDDTDDIDTDKASIKIADVLHRLKDEEAAPAKPKA